VLSVRVYTCVIRTQKKLTRVKSRSSRVCRPFLQFSQQSKAINRRRRGPTVRAALPFQPRTGQLPASLLVLRPPGPDPADSLLAAAGVTGKQWSLVFCVHCPSRSASARRR